MALDLGNFFPLLNNRATNDANREGTLLMEYVETPVTLATNTGDVEVPTKLSEVLGFIPLSYSSTFGAGDSVDNYTTDGVITIGAVTIRVNATGITDGAITIRGFLVGKVSASAITLNNI